MIIECLMAFGYPDHRIKYQKKNGDTAACISSESQAESLSSSNGKVTFACLPQKIRKFCIIISRQQFCHATHWNKPCDTLQIQY